MHTTLMATPATFAKVSMYVGALIAFYGCLRASEATSLQWKDIQIMPNSSGLFITLRQTKTGHGANQFVTISPLPDKTCPVAAFIKYKEQVSAYFPGGAIPQDYYVMNTTHLAKTPVTYQSFLSWLRTALAASLGPATDIVDFGTHSLRRGGTTLFLQAGVPASTVKAHGRWKSDEWIKYFDAAISDPAMATKTLAQTLIARIKSNASVVLTSIAK